MIEQDNSDFGALERARERLYAPSGASQDRRTPLPEAKSLLARTWAGAMVRRPGGHLRLAGTFFAVSVAFFVVALAIAGYFLYFNNNAVSVDKISIAIQGPTTIAAGNTTPLLIAITNKNPVAVSDARIEVDFPESARSAQDVHTPYPRYTEDLGTVASGTTITRPVSAILFGAAGDTVVLPVSFSYRIPGSNAVFVKKISYALTISSTPLSLSVATLSEVVSGKPFTLALSIRSNAAVPLDNVVVAASLPFGFSLASSSVPLTGSSFLLGTLLPGAARSIALSGTLTGQSNEQRVFRFTVGTASGAGDGTPAIRYMTQAATVAVASPFLQAALSINGAGSDGAVLAPGTRQNVSVSYLNTLATSVTNATIAVAISGAAVDYDSIKTSGGFYQSSTHTVIFDSGTEPILASLSPGASGADSFTFLTLPSSASAAPLITFTISVSGTRVGQANVPEAVTASAIVKAKVRTSVTLASASLHASGPLANRGPIPPRANEATTYTIVWNVQSEGSPIAGGVVTTILPTYVSYTNATAGAGSFSYDAPSRTVSWSAGDLLAGGSAQGAFQVSMTPSVSQRGGSPALTGRSSFSGYDRFAGVQVSTSADPVTTETTGDPGYMSSNAVVQ